MKRWCDMAVKKNVTNIDHGERERERKRERKCNLYLYGKKIKLVQIAIKSQRSYRW